MFANGLTFAKLSMVLNANSKMASKIERNLVWFAIAVLVKGTGVSKFYRFMGKTGRWVWMKSRGTVIYNSNQQPQYVVCINYVYT